MISRIRNGIEALIYRLIARSSGQLEYRKIICRAGMRAVREVWWEQSKLESSFLYWRYIYLLERTAEPVVREIPSDGRLRMVVYTPGHLGDVLQTVPMMRCLRGRFSEAKIIWVVGPWGVDLARRYSYADSVEVLAPSWYQYRRGGRGSSMREDLIWVRSREKRPTVLFISTSPAGLDTYLVGRAYRPARWLGRGPAFAPYPVAVNQTLIMPDKNQPEARDIISVVAPLGVIDDGGGLEYELDEPSRHEAEAILRLHGVDAEQRYVVLSSGAGWPGKQWLMDRWAQVADHLESKSIRVVLTGSKSEARLGEVIVSGMKHKPVNLIGQTSVAVMAGVIKRAILWLGGDSGGMHLAAAVGTPTLALFGPTNPAKWGASGSQHLKIHKNHDCAGCVPWHPRARCQHDGACMKLIEAQEVIRAIDQMTVVDAPVAI